MMNASVPSAQRSLTAYTTLRPRRRPLAIASDRAASRVLDLRVGNPKVNTDGRGGPVRLGAGSDLRPGEGTFASGFVDSVDIDVARGPDVVARVLDLPLRELCLRTDFGGNDDELLAVADALAARLPVGFGA